MEDLKTDAPAPVEVRILKDGPLLIKGNFSFRDASGKVITGEQELHLCRCGGSSSKPFCDGTHNEIGVVN
jgi:CDGSH-type Zn-finger protein